MSSATDAWARRRRASVGGAALAALLVALECTSAAGPVPAPAAVAASAAPISVDRVRALVAEFRADPEFAPRRTESHLHWTGDETPNRTQNAPPPSWLIGLAHWLADGARWAIWLLGALAVALVVVFAWRWIRVQADAVRVSGSLRPSHVNDLDIRPESLPADIAGTARALLERGSAREALSLLYRGALSNLVHVHGVAVRAASTEGECLLLARARLPQADADYFDRLVRAWQAEVYADRRQPPEALAGLCLQFDAHVGAAAGVARAAGEAA